MPRPGGSGLAPTGAAQFRDDWPGVVLHGDTPIPVATSIRDLQTRLADTPDVRVAHVLARLATIADIIERDVRAR